MLLVRIFSRRHPGRWVAFCSTHLSEYRSVGTAGTNTGRPILEKVIYLLGNLSNEVKLLDGVDKLGLLVGVSNHDFLLDDVDGERGGSIGGSGPLAGGCRCTGRWQ